MHRYTPAAPVTDAQIARYTVNGGAVVRRTLISVDINLVSDADKADLDEFMAMLGATPDAASLLAGYSRQPFSGFVATVDATPTVLVLIPTADNTNYLVETEVVVRGVAIVGGFQALGSFRRDSGLGTIAQFGTTNVLFRSVTGGALDVTYAVDVATGNIELRVTGDASALNWYGNALVTAVT